MKKKTSHYQSNKLEKQKNLEKADNFGPRCPEGENSRLFPNFESPEGPILVILTNTF